MTGLQKSVPKIKLTFPDGTPENHDTVLGNAVFAPVFNSLSPSTITTGGATLILTVNGIGLETTDTIKLMNGATEVCTSTKIVASERVECVTSVTSSIAQSNLKVHVGSVQKSCVSSCGITVDEANLPDVTSVSASSGTVISFSGTNLDQSSTHDISAKLGGTLGTNLNIGLGTVEFADGIPLGQNLKFELIYKDKTDNRKSYTAKSVTFSNANDISNALTGATAAATSCSFAGGCTLTINNANGLKSTLNNAGSSIKVCGKTCEIDFAASTATSVKCALPRMNTIYAEHTLHLDERTSIKGEIVGSAPTFAKKLFDGSNSAGWVGSPANCYFGTKFESGFVG